MKHIGLFEGIGGFPLAARYMGWETIAWCEWNEFGQKVLRYHFPEAEGHGDITQTDFTKYANRIDIVTGGFPCQPFSVAGKRKGTDDERHLWPEMLRSIREIKPTYVVGENVLGLVNWDGGVVFEQVQLDLENEGYEVQAYILPACGKNAPHKRYRVWFVAYSDSNRKMVQRGNRNSNDEKRNGEKEVQERKNKLVRTKEPSSKDASNVNGNGQNERNSKHEINTGKRGFDAFGKANPTALHSNGAEQSGEHFCKTWQGKSNGSDSGIGFDFFENFPTQPPICNGDDGLSERLDSITFSKWRELSIESGGNAIVPQIALEIFKAIEQTTQILTESNK
jgi:DNA (cytosine-5)-methyltransferase 1